MSDYTIVIQVDPHTRAFLYVNQATGEDASDISLVNGDRMVWVLDSPIPERTFQIDFPRLNPFQLGQAQSFRGKDFAVSPPVRVPITYPLGRGFKYSVSLGNGWRDDPRCTVVPEPPDPTTTVVLKSLKPAGTFNLAWTDATETNVVLRPKEDLTVTATGDSNLATVVWQWGLTQQDSQPFCLTFQNPPTGWTKKTLPSSPNPESITVVLPPGPKTTFTITTVSADQSTSITVTGSLEVDSQQKASARLKG